MKRLDYIVKGDKKVLIKSYEVRERKIKRTFEAMIDAAEEKAIESEEEAETILNSLKDVADNADSISNVLNKYIRKVSDAEDYRHSKEILEKAFAKLEDDVEVEETEE